MGFIKDRPISCIPTNGENYISFFHRAFDFHRLPTVFECLRVRVLKSYIEEEKIPLLLRKDVYTYEYFDNFEKFSETRLPPKSSFFNSLKDEDITQEVYDHAKNVFEQFRCRSLGDYPMMICMSNRMSFC